jgi:hypothetical protein
VIGELLLIIGMRERLMRCRLRFRISEIGVAGKDRLEGDGWERRRFGETQDFLPGVEHNSLMGEVTYPRFVNVGDDLLLTYRIGQ